MASQDCVTNLKTDLQLNAKSYIVRIKEEVRKEY